MQQLFERDVFCQLYDHIIFYLFPSYFKDAAKFKNRVFLGSIEAVPSYAYEPYLLVHLRIHIRYDFSELRCAVLRDFWITTERVLEQLAVFIDKVEGEVVGEVRFGLGTCEFWLARQ